MMNYNFINLKDKNLRLDKFFLKKMKNIFQQSHNLKKRNIFFFERKEIFFSLKEKKNTF